jgi:hypothetical protein
VVYWLRFLEILFWRFREVGWEFEGNDLKKFWFLRVDGMSHGSFDFLTTKLA